MLLDNGNKNARALRLHLAILFRPFSFGRFFFTEIMIKTTNHVQIRDQRVKIYKNPCFAFNSTLFEFLTAFLTVILNGS